MFRILWLAAALAVAPAGFAAAQGQTPSIQGRR
jgi:hypothetical protein